MDAEEDETLLKELQIGSGGYTMTSLKLSIYS